MRISLSSLPKRRSMRWSSSLNKKAGHFPRLFVLLSQFIVLGMKPKDRHRARTKELVIGVREAALRLGLSRWTLYHWAIEGRIPSVKLGGRRMFRPADLERLVGKQSKLSGS